MTFNNACHGADLFCGAGGTSTGLLRACEKLGFQLKLIAVNHSTIAIRTHSINHPDVDHLCDDIENADPLGLVPGGRLLILVASPECFTAETLILTSRGQLPICAIRPGDEVLTHRGRWRKVLQVGETTKKTLTVAGHGHPGMRVTAEHPFYTLSRTKAWDNAKRRYRFLFGEPEWTEAHGMAGRFWATPASFEQLPVPEVGGRGADFTAEFWWMVGRWLGDGTLRFRQQARNRPKKARRPARAWPSPCEECGKTASPNKRYPHLANFHCSDRCKSKADAVANASKGSSLQICCSYAEAEDLSNRLGKVAPTGRRAGRGEYRWSRRDQRTAVIFDCPHNGLATWLLEHFGQHAGGKYLPSWVFSLPVADRQSLLDGYVSADGHDDGRQIQINTISKALAIGVRLLATSLGHQAALHKVKAREHPIEGRIVSQHDQWSVRWIKNAERGIGHKTAEHAWSSVKMVSSNNMEETVYNLQVEEDESYVADGIVVHNCIYFSNARGGRPMNDQSRASVRYVLRWARALHIENLLIENVEEFTRWGPLLPCSCGVGDQSDGRESEDGWPAEHEKGCLFGRPDPERKGEFFRAFLDDLRGVGYTVDWRIVTCADYGDATTRRRFFLQAKRGIGDAAITWPEPTHAPRQSAAARNLRPWVPAREIIDWSLPGASIFDRKTPLKPNTLRRIFAGVSKFCGLEFIIGAGGPTGHGEPRAVEEPLKTVLTENHMALVQPYIVHFRNHCDARSVEEPLPTLTAGGQHVGLARPYLMVNRTHATPLSLDEPLRTLTTGGNFGLCQPSVSPFFVKYHGSHAGQSDGDDRSQSLEEPVPTLDTSNRMGLVQPFAVPVTHQGGPERTISLLDPLPTVTTAHRGEMALVRPFLVSYYGTGGPLCADDPLDTVTTRDRFALVDPRLVPVEHDPEGCGYEIIGRLDILFRMLQPHELAAAHSFPKRYVFFGKQDLKVKQVGNSVPVLTAEALCLELLKGARK